MTDDHQTIRSFPPATIVAVAAILLLVAFSGHLLRANLRNVSKLEQLRVQLHEAESAAPVVVDLAGENPFDGELAARLQLRLNEAQREVSLLRHEIDEKDRQIAESQTNPQRRRQPGEDATEDMQVAAQRRAADWMERMQRENPQRFEEIQTRIREMNIRRTEGIEAQTDFIATIDVEQLTEEQLENHTLLLTKLKDIKDLNARLENPGPDDDPREIRNQLRQEAGGIRELLEVERQIILQQLARDIGYDNPGAAQFAEYIEEAYRHTSPRNIMMGGFIGGRGARGARGGEGNDGDRRR